MAATFTLQQPEIQERLLRWRRRLISFRFMLWIFFAVKACKETWERLIVPTSGLPSLVSRNQRYFPSCFMTFLANCTILQHNCLTPPCSLRISPVFLAWVSAGAQRLSYLDAGLAERGRWQVRPRDMQSCSRGPRPFLPLARPVQLQAPRGKQIPRLLLKSRYHFTTRGF